MQLGCLRHHHLPRSPACAPLSSSFIAKEQPLAAKPAHLPSQSPDKNGVAHCKERYGCASPSARPNERPRACTDCATGAARARPTLPLRTLAPASTSFATSAARCQDNKPAVPQKEPKEAAQGILNALPGNNLVSKTAFLSAGAGLSVAAISNEIYVVNEESIIALSLLTIYWAVYNYAGPAYKEWAQGQADKFKNILNSARKDHTDAVKARISSVQDLSGVIDVTKNLFAVSKASRRPTSP